MSFQSPWEERLVSAFLRRYPGSSAAQGGRPLRIPAERLFPDFEQAPPDERESFLEAAEALGRKGLVTINWARRRKHEAIISLTYPDPEALFSLAGVPSPRHIAREARAAAEEAAARLAEDRAAAAAEDGTPPGDFIQEKLTKEKILRDARAFFDFLARELNPKDGASGIDRRTVEDFARLIHHVAAAGTQGLGLRALSVFLYRDSKRLEKIIESLNPLFARAARRNIAFPDLSFLDRSFPETLLAGRIRIIRNQGVPLDNATGAIIGFPLGSILQCKEIRLLRTGEKPPGSPDYPPRVLTVENKESFYVLANTAASGPDEPEPCPAWRIPGLADCVLYTGGHPNRAVAALVSLLSSSGFDFIHAGDLDPDGILILQEVSRLAGKPVCPLGMDRETFDRYESYGRTLEPSMLKRIKSIDKSTQDLPGIAELIRRIEETGLGIEQELIDYRGCIVR